MCSQTQTFGYTTIEANGQPCPATQNPCESGTIHTRSWRSDVVGTATYMGFDALGDAISWSKAGSGREAERILRSRNAENSFLALLQL
jgi:hypothetical protein